MVMCQRERLDVGRVMAMTWGGGDVWKVAYSRASRLKAGPDGAAVLGEVTVDVAAVFEEVVEEDEEDEEEPAMDCILQAAKMNTRGEMNSCNRY